MSGPASGTVARGFVAWLLVALALSLSACASVKGPGSPGQRQDPWENWNRKVFNFNERLDEAVLKPVATAYSEIIPSPIRQGVDNFFGNVNDAWSAVNLFLQGRFKYGVQQTMRVAVNSTLGFAGVLDIAGEAGLERRSEDLGKTFARWGTGSGAYIVWPVFGPSTVRDSIALPFDRLASPALLLQGGDKQLAIYALQNINARSNFLRAGEMLDGIALDKYTFIRDAYLTKRRTVEEDEDDDYEVLVPDAPPVNPQADR